MVSSNREQSLDSVSGFLLDTVLNSYSLALLAKRRWVGASLLLATFVCEPWIGVTGLVALLSTVLIACVFGFDRQLLRTGVPLCNSLIVGLLVATAWYASYSALVLLALACIFALLTLFLTVVLSVELQRRLFLPAVGLPVVAIHLVACFALDGPHPLEDFAWPDELLRETSGFDLESLAFIVNSTGLQARLAILLVFVATLCYSRLLVLYAAVGLASGIGLLTCLATDLSTVDSLWVLANCTIVGMAVGGVFFIPSRASLILALFAATTCGLIAIALVQLFLSWGFWPVLLPASLVLPMLIYVLRLRMPPRYVHFVPFVPESPEENFRRFRSLQNHFPEYGLPAAFCPFSDERVVTQGFDGRWTHKGDWRYGLDFEVLDREGHNHSGDASRLEEYYTFNTPVLAPAPGTVVKVVDQVEDRPIGENNLGENWGNLVIILLDGGPFLKLCHLRQGSIHVREGQHVQMGELLGYCGNSGRSPVPHLHLQMQLSAHVGAPTIPFRLRHYIERRNETEGRYTAVGVPAEGARIESARLNVWLARCFDDVARRDYRFERVRGKSLPSEVVSCVLDEMGCYRFLSDKGACLSCYVADSAFHVLDYRGTDESVLYWVWLGINRVPFLENRRVCWHDRVDVRPMLNPLAGGIVDLTGPLGFYPAISIKSRWEPSLETESNLRPAAYVESVVERSSSLAADLPRRIRIGVSTEDWITSVEVETGDDHLFIEQKDPTPAK